jgi:hypothetical protein
LASSAPEPTFAEQNSQNLFKRESVGKVGNARYFNEMPEEIEQQHRYFNQSSEKKHSS